MRYTLRQLRYFVAAGESGSITKAAARIHVSQPSISAAVAHLEDVFGVQLFVRHRAHGLSPTPAGQRLLGEAKRLLRQAEGLHHAASELGDSLSGELEVGCFTTLAPLVMPSLIKEFCALHPEARIRCHEVHQEDLLDGLARGRFEVALAYDLHLGADFAFDPVAAFPTHAIVAPDHRLARRARISLGELIDDPMILLDLPHSRDYFRSLFLSLGLEPRIAHRTASPHMVRALVANGFGYSLMNARVDGDRALDGRPFRVIALADKVRPLRLGVVTLARGRPTRLAAAFAGHCHKAWTSRRPPAAAPPTGKDTRAPARPRRAR